MGLYREQLRAEARAKDAAACDMLAALKRFANVFARDAGLDAADHFGLAAEVLEARDAITVAEAAGIKS